MAVDAALVLPIVLVMVFLAVQAGLWFFARTVVHAAAQQGARAAAAREASLETGLDAASGFAGHVGGGLVTGVSVSGDRSGTYATVTVKGESVRLIPLLDLHVTQSATLPVERFS